MVYEIYNNEKGQRHRIGGPAYINGEWKVWFINGHRHRIDGPAYIHGNRQDWWINNELINPDEYIHEGIKVYNRHYVI